MRNFVSISILVLLLLQYTLARSGVDNNNNNNNNRVFTAELTQLTRLNNNITEEEQYEHELNFLANRYGWEVLGGISNVKLMNFADRRFVMKIGIGEGNIPTNVLIDTGSATLWVITTECEDKIKSCKGHEKVDVKKQGLTQLKQNDYQQHYAACLVKGDTLYGTVYLGNGLKVEKQTFGGVKIIEGEVTPGIDGVFGLAIGDRNNYPNPFINAVSQNNLQLAPIFSIYIKEGEGANKGEITFGGNNEARFYKNTKVTAKLVVPLLYQIQMTSLTSGGLELCKYDKKKFGQCVVMLDTGAPFLYGPAAVVNEWAQRTFKKLNTKKQPYRFDCAERDHLPPFNIQIEGEQLTIEADYYTRESAGGKCYLRVIAQDIPNIDWLFGVPFHFKYYTEYNVKAGEESVTFYHVKANI